MKTPGPSAAGIQVDDAVALGLSGLVSVPADHKIEVGSFGSKVEFAEVVEDVEDDPMQFDDGCHGELARPVVGVHVAPNSKNRGDTLQTVQHFERAHVTGVNDSVDAVEGLTASGRRRP